MDESELIAQVRAAVAHVFEIADPGTLDPDQDLILYGLDSLKMAELAGELATEFGFDPLIEDGEPVLDLECLTIRVLAGRIAEARATEAPQPPPPLTDDLPIPGRTRLKPLGSIPSLTLEPDDFVPISMLVVLGYAYDLVPQLPTAIQHGLDAFPHFAGRLSGGDAPAHLAIEADDSGISVETAHCHDVRIDDLSDMGHNELIERFLPQDSDQARRQKLDHPLFAVRATQTADGGSVLGMLVSHLLVDATGLSLFMRHCTAGAHRGTAPVPIHSRESLRRCASTAAKLPRWYAESEPDAGRSGPDARREWEMAANFRLSVFTVADEDLKTLIGDPGANAWFHLTAFLCRRLGEWAGFDEVALWCDIRGDLPVPRHYTGNVGCYWHEDLTRRDESLDELADRLRYAVRPEGRSRAAEVYQAIKQVELDGGAVRWTGTEPNVLPVNLVPYSASALDFGGGGPRFASILTRNLHGLRISRHPTDSAFVVEACLPDPYASSLVQRCRANHLSARQVLLEPQ